MSELPVDFCGRCKGLGVPGEGREGFVGLETSNLRDTIPVNVQCLQIWEVDDGKRG